MLQHNTAAQRAHLAHAAVVALHAVCCGLPLAAMLLVGMSGALSAGVLLPDSFGIFHQWLHGYEIWVVALSVVLVAFGAWLEVDARRGGHVQGFPWLFTFSTLCLVMNLGVVLAH